MRNISLSDSTYWYNAYNSVVDRFETLSEKNGRLLHQIKCLEEEVTKLEYSKIKRNTAVYSGSKLIPMYPKKGGQL